MTLPKVVHFGDAWLVIITTSYGDMTVGDVYDVMVIGTIMRLGLSELRFLRAHGCSCHALHLANPLFTQLSL